MASSWSADAIGRFLQERGANSERTLPSPLALENVDRQLPLPPRPFAIYPPALYFPHSPGHSQHAASIASTQSTDEGASDVSSAFTVPSRRLLVLRRQALRDTTTEEPTTSPSLRRLPCEFHSWSGCTESFDPQDITTYVEHVSSLHLRYTFPNRCTCWFCDDVQFECSSELASEDEREQCYRSRMAHIAAHYSDDVDLGEARPDSHFLSHLYDQYLISGKEFRAAIQKPEEEQAMGLLIINSMLPDSSGLRKYKLSYPKSLRRATKRATTRRQFIRKDSALSAVSSINAAKAGYTKKASNEQSDSSRGEKSHHTTKAAPVPVDSRKFIFDLSCHISGNLQNQTIPEDWTRLSKLLPQLIRTFAIKIGEDDSLTINQEIMLLIHKNHEKFVAQLKCFLLHQGDTEHIDLPGDEMTSMSLDEKMIKWHQSVPAKTTVGGIDKMCERIDGNNKVAPHSGLSTYAKRAIDSTAYSWFLDVLRREFSHRCRMTPSSPIMQDIRRKILDSLPSNIDIDQRTANEQRATFQLQWEPLAARLRYEHGRLKLLPGRSVQVSDLVTLTSSGETQATSVKEYFGQTWSSCGQELLEVLQETIESLSGASKLRILSDATQVATRIYRSRLLLTLAGQAYQIADYGEQLCWLASALQPPHEGYLNYNLSSIERLNGRIPDILRIPEPVGAFRSLFVHSTKLYRQKGTCQPAVGFKIEVLESSTRLSQFEGRFWHAPPQHPLIPVIAKGFPIARQPLNVGGLEISLELILRTAGANRVSLDGEGPHIKGCWFSLRAMDTLEGICYWYEVQQTSGEVRPDEDLSTRASSSLPPAPIHLELEKVRHVICDPSRGGYSSYCFKNDGDAMSVVDTSTGSASLHTGLLSVSSDSVNDQRADYNGQGFQFFRNLLRCLVLAFQNGTDGGISPSNVSSSTAPTSLSKTSASANRFSLNPARKRQRRGSSDSDGNNRPSRERSKFRRPNGLEKPRFLACPFWKLEPEKHWECFMKRITTIGYVKQHLNRRHTPTFYCQLCFAVFEDENTHDRHVTDASCSRDPLLRLEGISQHQSKQLSNKSKGTVEAQWYSMWRIIFPNQEPPSSIYVDPDQSQDFALLREFSHRHGVAILQNEIRTSALFLRPGIADSELRDALLRGLDSMFEYFRAGRVPGSPPSTSAPSHSPSDQQSRNEASGNLDSARQTSSGPSSHGSPVGEGCSYPPELWSAEVGRPNTPADGQPPSLSRNAHAPATDPTGLDPEILQSTQEWSLDQVEDTEMSFPSLNLDELLNSFTTVGDAGDLYPVNHKHQM